MHRSGKLNSCQSMSGLVGSSFNEEMFSSSDKTALKTAASALWPPLLPSLQQLPVFALTLTLRGHWLIPECSIWLKKRFKRELFKMDQREFTLEISAFTANSHSFNEPTQCRRRVNNNGLILTCD